MARQSVKGVERRLGLGEANHVDHFFSRSIRRKAKGKAGRSKPATYWLDKVVDIASFRVLLQGYSSLGIGGPAPVAQLSGSGCLLPIQ